MELSAIHEKINAGKDANVSTLLKFVSQPSLAAANTGIQECVQTVCDLLRSIKIEPELIPTAGAPAVYGELCSGAEKKTILFYGHYDVQPAEPLESWVSPPFEPEIRNGRVYGRGVGDNKGQLLAHILAVRAYQECKAELPVNIKFLIEGEEEVSSPHLLDVIQRNKDRLKADLCYISDGALHANGSPILYFGNRGVTGMQMEITTSKYDNHSGNKGNLIPNAAWEMVKLLSAMIDENGKCRIPGFYDDVAPVSPHDEALIDELEYEPERFAQLFGVKEITMSRREYFTNLMFQPTFSLNGLCSGHTGTGPKTIIPGSAVAKFDMRLVDNQDPDKIFELVSNYAKSICPGVVISQTGRIWPSSTPSSLPICQAVIAAVETAYQRKPVIMPRVGATLPTYMFTKIVGNPTVLVPYANADENNHAPNENMTLECYHNGIHCTAEVIAKVGCM